MAQSVRHVTNGIVSREASSAVDSVSSCAIASESVAAEIIPDILTADVRLHSVTPAQVMNIYFSAASVMANL